MATPGGHRHQTALKPRFGSSEPVEVQPRLVEVFILTVGNHTLQIQGVGEDGFIKSSNLGVLVEEPVTLTGPSSFALVFSAVGVFLGILAILLVVFLMRRKRA